MPTCRDKESNIADVNMQRRGKKVKYRIQILKMLIRREDQSKSNIQNQNTADVNMQR